MFIGCLKKDPMGIMGNKNQQDNLEEVKILKLLAKPPKRYLVTVPKEIIRDLGLEGGEKVKVLLDRENERVVYEFLE